MADIPQRISGAPQSAIASYDWTDIASGSGYVKLYGCMANEGSGTNEFLLVDTIIESNTDWAYEHSWGAYKFNAGEEINIDTFIFNLPKTIKGRPYAAGYITYDGGADELQLKIIKVDKNDNETDLTEWKNTIDIGNSGGDEEFDWGRFLIFFDEMEVKIKKGEKIRIKAKASTEKVMGLSPTGKVNHEGISKRFTFGLPIDIAI